MLLTSKWLEWLREPGVPSLNRSGDEPGKRGAMVGFTPPNEYSACELCDRVFIDCRSSASEPGVHGGVAAALRPGGGTGVGTYGPASRTLSMSLNSCLARAAIASSVSCAVGVAPSSRESIKGSERHSSTGGSTGSSSSSPRAF